MIEYPFVRPLRSGGLRRAGVAVFVVALLFGAGPVSAKPATPTTTPASRDSEKLDDLKAQGEKAQRIAETRQRRWDRKMKAVSGSICNGC